jgi:hypothetical protein
MEIEGKPTRQYFTINQPSNRLTHSLILKKERITNFKRPKAIGKISALFEFLETGQLKSVFLNAQDERDQVILEKSLYLLLGPQKFNFFKRLLRRG